MEYGPEDRFIHRPGDADGQSGAKGYASPAPISQLVHIDLIHFNRHLTCY